MKKIVCLLLCLITYNAYADNLLDAIRSRDVPMVKQLLANNSFNVDYYDIYATAIEESLWMAREQMLLQRLKPAIDPTYGQLYAASVVASFTGFGLAVAYEKAEWAIFLMMLPLLTTPLIIKGAHIINDLAQQHYKDALQIQDLVFTTFADIT